LRKQTVEPGFGIIKRVMGWRQMSMRGLAKAQGEWSLVTMGWNIKRRQGSSNASRSCPERRLRRFHAPYSYASSLTPNNITTGPG
jgi:hypothetical protein